MKLELLLFSTILAIASFQIQAQIAPQPQFLSNGIYNVITPTLTNGQIFPFQLDVNGNLKTTATLAGTVTLSGPITVQQPTAGALNMTEVNSSTIASDLFNIDSSLATIQSQINSFTATPGFAVPGEAIYSASKALDFAPIYVSGNAYPLVMNRLGELTVVSHNNYTNLIGAGTANAIKSGYGRLHTVTFNTQATGSLTIFDSLTGTGTTIATMTQSASKNMVTLILDVDFRTGLSTITRFFAIS